MKDLVPKGTGNSRFLRSSISENITHEELVALLRAGTFPVDFSGLNADGVAVVGSAYNKANVLPDDLCNGLGIPTTAEPKDAFLSLNKKKWRELARLTVSGTYTVPDGIYQLGVFCMGGGMGGGVCQYRSGRSNVIPSASSGFIRSEIIDVTPGQKINYVIGAAGAGVTGNEGNEYPTNGGDTIFGEITALGGKVNLTLEQLNSYGIQLNAPKALSYTVYSCGFCCGLQTYGNTYVTAKSPAINGFNPWLSSGGNANIALTLPENWTRNMFDTKLTFGAAGGHAATDAESSKPGTSLQPASAETDLGRGGAAGNPNGENATGYGNGGGAGITQYTTGGGKGGNGSPGIIILYA